MTYQRKEILWACTDCKFVTTNTTVVEKHMINTGHRIFHVEEIVILPPDEVSQSHDLLFE